MLMPSAGCAGAVPATARGTKGTPAKTPPSHAAGRAQQRAERPRPWTKSAPPAGNGTSPGSGSRAAHLARAAAQHAGPLVLVRPEKGPTDISPRDRQQRPQRSGADSRRSSVATPRSRDEGAGPRKTSLSPSGGVPVLRLRSTARRSAPPAYRLDELAGAQLTLRPTILSALIQPAYP